MPGGPRGILLLLPALAAVSFAGFILLRKHASSGPEPLRVPPGAVASGAPEPLPAPPDPEPGRDLRSAPRDQGTARFELWVLDDQGRSPGPSDFCVEGVQGGATYGRTDEKGKAVVVLPGDPRSGEYRVYAGRLDPGRKLYWARDRFLGTQTSFTVTYHRRSEIQGIASDADGQRLRDAQIRVRVRGIFPAGDPAAAVFQKLMKGSGDWEFQYRADAAGTFRLDHLSSDLGLRFDLAALQEGQAQSIETDLSQEADGPSSTVLYRAPAPAQYSVILTRHRVGVVSASAVTWDGLPVPQALLSFRVESGKNSGELGPRAVLRTDGLGRGKAPWKELADGSTPFPKGATRYWAAAWKKGLGLAYSSGTLDPARPEVVVRFPKGQTGPSRRRCSTRRASSPFGTPR